MNTNFCHAKTDGTNGRAKGDIPTVGGTEKMLLEMEAGVFSRTSIPNDGQLEFANVPVKG